MERRGWAARSQVQVAGIVMEKWTICDFTASCFKAPPTTQAGSQAEKEGTGSVMESAPLATLHDW